MNRLLIAVALCAALALSAGGCTWARFRTNVEDFYSKADQVIPGRTSGKDLPRILGTPPNVIMDLEGKKQVYVYNFGDAKTAALTLLLLNVSKTNRGDDHAYFIVNAGGVVEEKLISTNSRDLPWQWWAFGGE